MDAEVQKVKFSRKKKEMSPVAFAQNYESRWVGSADHTLVNINKLLDCRSLTDTQSKQNLEMNSI